MKKISIIITILFISISSIFLGFFCGDLLKLMCNELHYSTKWILPINITISIILLIKCYYEYFQWIKINKVNNKQEIKDNNIDNINRFIRAQENENDNNILEENMEE